MNDGFFLNDGFFHNISEPSGDGLKWERIKLNEYVLTKNGIRDLANQAVIIFKGSDEKQKEIVADFLENNLFDEDCRKLCESIQGHPKFKAVIKKIKPDSLAATLLGIAV